MKKWYETANKISWLRAYIDTRRGVGHTFTMVNGVRNNDVGAVVLVVSQTHANQFKKECPKETRFVAWDDLDKIKGLSKPLAVDNFTLSQILGDVLDAFNQLREENEQLKWELKVNSKAR